MIVRRDTPTGSTEVWARGAAYESYVGRWSRLVAREFLAWIAVYVWDYAGRMQLIREFWDAAIRLDPAAAALDEGVRFPICDPDRLRTLFEQTGFEGVEVRAIEVVTTFQDFEECWRPFLGGQGPAPGYVAALPERHRGELRDALRARLPVAADGSIALVARAWAARGTA